jgi:hypothetical protein
VKFLTQNDHLQQNVKAEDHRNAGAHGYMDDLTDHIGQGIYRGYAQVAVDGDGNTKGDEQQSKTVDDYPQRKLGGCGFFHVTLSFKFSLLYRRTGFLSNK